MIIEYRHLNIFDERFDERSNLVRTRSSIGFSGRAVGLRRVVKNETEITDAQVNVYDDFYIRGDARCIVGTFEMRVTAEASFIGRIRLHVIV